MVANSVHRQDQSINLGIYDSDTAWRPDWNQTVLSHAGSTSVVVFVRGGADISLARPTSRCRRAESIVSLERGACLCADLQVFSCYRFRKEAWQAWGAISTTCRRKISIFFFLAKARCRRKFTPLWQKYYGSMHHHLPPSKTGWSSLNRWFFHLWCASSWTTQNSDHPGDYWSNSRANLGRPPEFG